MPRVPRYDGPQVEARGLPSARVSTDAPIEAFGGGRAAAAVGEATRGLAGAAIKIGEEQYAIANKLRVTEERDALWKKEQELLYAPQTGALHLQGKNAFGSPDKVGTDWTKFIAEREKGLDNEDQRQAFRELSGARWHSMSQRLNEHVAQQTKVYEDGVFNSALESSKERGSVDPRLVPAEAAFMTREIEQRAMLQGWSPEQKAQEIQKHRSDLYARTTDALLTSGQDLAAERFFRETKASMDPDVARKLEAAVEEGSRRKKAQTESDALLGKHRTLGPALEAAKTIEDPKLRDEVERRVKEGFSERRAAERDREEQLYKVATNIVEQKKSFDAIPANIVALLPLSARTGLRSYAEALQAGRKITTDLATYYDLQTMAANPGTKNEFLETNLLEYRTKLSETDFKHFADLQGGLRMGDKEQELDGIRTNLQIVNDTLAAAGIDPTPTQGSAAVTANLARRKIDEAVAVEAQRLGRPLKNEEVSRVAEEQVVKGVTQKSPWFWPDTKKRRFETAPGEAFDVLDVDELPRPTRLRIEGFLRGKGVNPTADKVLELYRRMGGARAAR